MNKLTKEKNIARANRFFKENKFEKCIKFANRILRYFPKELSIYLLKMDSLLRIDDHYTIRETAFQYLNNSPKEENNYVVAIKYLDDAESQDLSVKLMEEALKLYPESYDLAFSNLRRLYLHNKDNDQEIIEFIDSFPKTIPFWIELMLFKAKIYKNLKDYNKSLEIYNEILESSFEGETISRKFETLRILDREDEAMELIDKIMAENNDKNEMLVNKGLYYTGKNNQKAMEFIDEAIENNPEDGFFYFAKASVLFEMGNYEDVVEYINKATSLDENLETNPNLQFLLAKMDLQAKDFDSAIEIINHVDFRFDIFEDVIMFADKVNELKIQDLLEQLREKEKNDDSFKSHESNGLLFSEQIEKHIKSGNMQFGADRTIKKLKNNMNL